MTTSRPYLIRAMYEWIVDNGMTPHILVATDNDEVMIPRQFEENGKIVLNISPTAIQSLQLGNEEITFNARFGGTPMEVLVPVRHIMAVYARENGRGMMFGPEDDTPSPDSETSDTSNKPSRPNLKVVK